MEQLLAGTDDDDREIALYLAELASLDECGQALADARVTLGDGFAMLVAGQLDVASTDAIADFAEWCIGHGVFYMSAWGPGCERCHDIFDEADVKLSVEADEPGGAAVVMTTWHDHEPLSETLEFF